MTFATEENITELALRRFETTHDPRLRAILLSLIKHAHAFVRDSGLTIEEWLAATEYLQRTGAISDEKRKEFILLSDVLGISMLVVMSNQRADHGTTPATVLGPFHIEGSEELEPNGKLPGEYAGVPLHMSGTVRSTNGTPIANATLDTWQADEEGTYESQIPDSGARLRAIVKTDADGKFSFWTIAPKGYSIPMDGPVGDLIRETDISQYRPAHIHFLMSSEGYEPVITHIFAEGTQYLQNDVVFGVRSELVTPFRTNPPGIAPDGTTVDVPFISVKYDFALSPARQ